MKKLMIALALTSAACIAPATCEHMKPEPQPVFLKEPVPPRYSATLVELLTVLAARTPLDAPVLVIVEDQEGYWGTTAWNPETSQYEIRLNPFIYHPDFLGSILRHEWAHAASWDVIRAPGADPHDAAWGVALADAYRATLAGPPSIEEAEAVTLVVLAQPVPAGPWQRPAR